MFFYKSCLTGPLLEESNTLRPSLKVLKCSTVSSADIASIIIHSEPKWYFKGSFQLLSGTRKSQSTPCLVPGSQGVTEGNLVLEYNDEHQALPFVLCMRPADSIALCLASDSHFPFLKVLTSSPNTTMSFSPRLDLTPGPIISPQIGILLVLLMLKYDASQDSTAVSLLPPLFRYLAYWLQPRNSQFTFLPWIH